MVDIEAATTEDAGAKPGVAAWEITKTDCKNFPTVLKSFELRVDVSGEQFKSPLQHDTEAGYID
jgi:hypothetical protein